VARTFSRFYPSRPSVTAPSPICRFVDLPLAILHQSFLILPVPHVCSPWPAFRLLCVFAHLPRFPRSAFDETRSDLHPLLMLFKIFLVPRQTLESVSPSPVTQLCAFISCLFRANFFCPDPYTALLIPPQEFVYVLLPLSKCTLPRIITTDVFRATLLFCPFFFYTPDLDSIFTGAPTYQPLMITPPSSPYVISIAYHERPSRCLLLERFGQLLHLSLLISLLVSSPIIAVARSCATLCSARRSFLFFSRFLCQFTR